MSDIQELLSEEEVWKKFHDLCVANNKDKTSYMARQEYLQTGVIPPIVLEMLNLERLVYYRAKD